MGSADPWTEQKSKLADRSTPPFVEKAPCSSYPRIRHCQKLSAKPARADEKVFIDLDGEQPGLLPATWEIVPAAIDLLV